MKYFINLSTHNHRFWSKLELEEASKYGQIVDWFPFEVTSEVTLDKIKKEAKKTVDCVIKVYGVSSTVYVEANHIFTYYVVSFLKEKGIKAVYAYSKRLEREWNETDEIIMMEKKFVFEKFIEY